MERKNSGGGCTPLQTGSTVNRGMHPPNEVEYAEGQDLGTLEAFR